MLIIRCRLIVGGDRALQSGYRFVEQAHRLGKPVFAINLGVTRADHLLTAKVEADCGNVLVDIRTVLNSHDQSEMTA